MIQNFTPRLYQETILATTVSHNTLVVLPTGLGKTNLFLMLASKRLSQYPGSKILMLGPTRPLISQYYEVFKKHFTVKEDQMSIFTGNVKPETRARLWEKSKIIFSTPQGLENDIINRKINLEDVSLLCFDEAHRATGDYSYVWIAKQYNKLSSHPKILALTASPGSDIEKISEICKNLYIEEIEVRTDADPDVAPYIQEVKISWVKVELPENFIQIKRLIEECYNSKLRDIKKFGYLNSAQVQYASKTEILKLQASLQAQIAKGDKSFEVLKSVSLAAEAMKIQHGLELLETQGISSLNNYLQKINSQASTSKTKAVQNLARDINFRSALIKTASLFQKGIEHPKLSELRKIINHEISKNKHIKIIIFNQYRDSALEIQLALNKLTGADARLFVGQAKKGTTGLTQKNQIAMLDQFRNNEFNILVATAVGEEGLDIPQVDLVIFYEPIPSAIRTIQRRGRTGRLDKGRVMVLMTKSTRDEGYRWSAHHKEKRMYRTLNSLKSKLSNVVPNKPQQTLPQFSQKSPSIKIFADYREKGSSIIKELIDLGATINLEKLDIGDYLASNRACIEFKKSEDFVNSIIDGRLLQQVKELRQNYERPVLIVEGEQDIYNVRNIHPNAIRGMLATIAVGYGIPIIYTKNSQETASLILMIANREQEDGSSYYSLHGDRKPASLKQQQEYIVSSFPNIGANLAKELLREFKTIKNIINADLDSLKNVDKVGDKKASAISKIVNKEYEF